jgi:hypothetical protein
MVSISFFRYKGFEQRWWAFKQMRQATAVLKKVEGLSFTKLLGSGGKQGFGILPDWGLYGLLGVWNNADAAHNFFNHHPLLLDFKSRSICYQHIFLEPLSSHGKWDGQEPFANPKQKTAGKIAVITRAKIKLSKLWQFWRFVSPASKDMQNKDGLIFSVGIGEIPLIQQATFSIWENSEKMMQYAYKSPQHTQVIQKTKELNWYSEALFARFAVEGTEGNCDTFCPSVCTPENN